MPVTRLRLAGIAVVCAVTVTTMVPAFAAATPVQRTWHADQARIPDARAAGRDGSGVLVAVLDSWVDRAHPDFQGRVLAGADCVGGTCRRGPASSDKCEHGTHVSGTIASSSFGVAPRAKVLPVRVLTYDPMSGGCVGRPDDVAAGIRWAVAQGAQVLNLSLGPNVAGLSTSSTIPAAVQDAAAAGAVVVFSAGNAGIPVTDSYGDAALIVAATGPSGRLASYSQRGAGVDLAAPGGDPRTRDVCTKQDCVTSLFPGGRYALAAGTSMAAPHVAGIAALLIAQNPSRTREQVLRRLLDTARPLFGAGRGLVDARAALGVIGSATTRSQATTTATPIARPSARPSRVRPAPAPALAPAPSPLEPGPSAPSPASSPSRIASLSPTTAPSPAATDPARPAQAAPPEQARPLPGQPADADPDGEPGRFELILLASGLILLAGSGGTALLRRRA